MYFHHTDVPPSSTQYTTTSQGFRTLALHAWPMAYNVWQSIILTPGRSKFASLLLHQGSTSVAIVCGHCMSTRSQVNSYDPDDPCASMLHTNTSHQPCKRADVLLPVLLSRYAVPAYYHTVGLVYVGDTVKKCSSTIRMFHLQARCSQAPLMVSLPWRYMHGPWHTRSGTASF